LFSNPKSEELELDISKLDLSKEELKNYYLNLHRVYIQKKIEVKCRSLRLLSLTVFLFIALYALFYILLSIFSPIRLDLNAFGITIPIVLAYFVNSGMNSFFMSQEIDGLEQILTDIRKKMLKNDIIL